MQAAIEFFDNTMKEMKMMKLNKEHKTKILDIKLKTFIGSKTGGFCDNYDSTTDASTVRVQSEYKNLQVYETLFGPRTDNLDKIPM